MKWNRAAFSASRMIWSLICAGILASSIGLFAQEERIARFESRILVKADGHLDVTEIISVLSTGDQIRRGIYRDFPVELRTSWGLKRRVGFEVLQVLRDGKPEAWHRRDDERRGYARIYIGQPDVFLPPGAHIYTLRYTTDRQLLLQQEFEELYWNVTGNEWAFPMDAVSATVFLPEDVNPRSVDIYTGRRGEKGMDARVVTLQAGKVVIETTRALLPGEGLTISVTWPKGYLHPDVRSSNSFGELLKENASPLAAAGFLLVVLLYYLAVWIVLGRDPPRGTIIPQFAPPEGMSPAAVRYIRGMGKFDDRSFAAAVIELAVAGALEIQKNGVYVLKKREPQPELEPAQKKLLDSLFAKGKSITLEQANHTVLGKARQGVLDSLTGSFERAYFIRNSGWWFVGTTLSLLPAWFALQESVELVPAIFMLVWISIWTLGVTALLSNLLSNLRAGRIISAIPMALFSLPFVAGWFFGAFLLWNLTSLWTIGIFVVGTLLNATFYHLLKAPTIEGRKVMDHIEGFRHYLSVAERDRMDAMAPPARTPELFEKFFPYALALDVEQKWAEQFSDVLAAAKYAPKWCSGSGMRFGGTADFSNALSGAFTGSLAAAATAPRGRGGSGGGGSSGGGGGGGGGGGW